MLFSSFFFLCNFLCFSFLSLISYSYFCISSSFFALVDFLFQPLPFVCLSLWTWGNGRNSIITGVSLGVSFLSISFPVYLHHSLSNLEFFLVPMHGVFDPSLEPCASSSRGCIQRAVKMVYGKGTGIYSCSITDREEYIGAFRWGDCLPWLY